MGQEAGPRLWRFGAVEVDESRASVRVGGTEVALDRSSYDVLLALLRHRGEIVTRGELLDAGWPGRVVSENSLSKAISRLRPLLGADGACLRVVHGYGYRLAAAVSAGAAGVDGAGAGAATDPVARLAAGDPLPFRPGWRLDRRLGEGAAGVIHLAVSADGESRAIKFSTGEAGLRSLKREVSLSKYLQSQRAAQGHVVPVLGWNLARPPCFLELPYHEDGNLRDWAAVRGGLEAIAPTQRLGLAIALCEAVAALHAVGIIHRDLKPENIYPLADPDAPGGWRIALADLGAGDAATTPHLAALGITMSVLDTASAASPRHVGSLLYVSPEVIAGGPHTLRSDVFSLGVLLYQLAAGNLRRTLAPGWEADIPDELLREDIALAAAAEPERRNVDAQGLVLRLRALASRREERLRERRRADDERARARQALRERGRRRLLVAVSATLCLGLAGTGAMYASAEQARQAAERQFRERQAVLAFVTDDILGQADPYRNPHAGPGLTLLDAVERAAQRVDARVSDPAAAAAVHAMVGSVFFAQDRHADAIAQYEHARSLYRRLGDDWALATLDTALCDVHRIAGDLAAAEGACRSALRRADLSGQGRALAVLKLGQLRGEQGRDAESLALLEPLLAADAFAAEPRLRGELHWALGLAHRSLGRYGPARRQFEALLALQRDGAAAGTWAAWAYNSLGSVLVRTGDFDAAERTLLQARRLFQATQGAGQVEAQMPNIWRGEIRLHRGQWREAIRMQEALLDAWRPTLGPDHALWLKAEANLAWAEAESGLREAATGRLHAALRDRAVVFDRPGDHVAVRTMRWTRAALALGPDAPTAELFAILDAALPREFPGSHPVRAEADCLRARWALQRREAGEARDHAAACLRMLAGFVGQSHPLSVEARDLLAAAGSPPPTQATPAARAVR